jgi:sulfur carrier protein ThiS
MKINLIGLATGDGIEVVADESHHLLHDLATSMHLAIVEYNGEPISPVEAIAYKPNNQAWQYFLPEDHSLIQALIASQSG